MARHRAEIAEIENRGKYRVWHDGEVICESRTPFLSAARVLLGRGADLDVMLEKVPAPIRRTSPPTMPMEWRCGYSRSTPPLP